MLTALGNILPLPGEDSVPHPVDICIHLGRTKRFAGHGSAEWTVLHHSLLTTLLCLKNFGATSAVAALVHDLHEYVTGDLPTPVKRCLTGTAELEKHVDKAIGDSLGLAESSEEDKKIVKVCDIAALLIESHYFGPAGTFEHIGVRDWPNIPEHLQDEVYSVIRKSCPEIAEAMRNSHSYWPTALRASKS